MRARLVAQAKKRQLKLATVARVLIEERLTEIENAELVSATETWQRAQAWASWEGEPKATTTKSGLAQLARITERGLRRMAKVK